MNIDIIAVFFKVRVKKLFEIELGLSSPKAIQQRSFSCLILVIASVLCCSIFDYLLSPLYSNIDTPSLV